MHTMRHLPPLLAVLTLFCGHLFAAPPAAAPSALAYPGNPIDRLAPLAKAKIALIHVVGDADDVVPPAENAAIIEERYKALGGIIQTIHKPGVGHHPHGLDDSTAVVKFIIEHGAQR